MRISCSQWGFSLSPIYERKTWKNLNIEIQNFISIFVFRYSPPWCFCAQICTIANVLIANIMFVVEVHTFTHLGKKNLEKIEYRNIEFYFDLRFSIFGHFAVLCSKLYYSMRAHLEYHVRSEDAQFEYRSRSYMPFSKSEELRCSELSLFRSSLVHLRCRSYLPYSKSEELLDLLISGHSICFEVHRNMFEVEDFVRLH